MPAAASPPTPVSARLASAVALSLLLHALLLSLQFGMPGIGLPALEAPWRERRAQADLHLTIAGPTGESAAPQAAAPMHAAPLPAPSGLRLHTAPEPASRSAAVKRSPPSGARTGASAGKQRSRARREQPPVIALTESHTESFAVPPPSPEATPPEIVRPEPDAQVAPGMTVKQEDEAAETREAERRARERANEEERRREQEQAERLAREQRDMQQAEEQRLVQAERLALEEQARRQEDEIARRQAALALETQQEEIRRREREQAAQRALELEAQRKDEARREEAARLAREVAELEARKAAEEAARRQAALERQRQEEQLAARRKSEEEAASLRAREAAVISVEPPAAALPRDLTGGLASRALEQARRPELLRNDVPAARAPDAIDAPRRHSVFGKIDRDVGLMMYVESWRLKVERNGNLNYRQSSADKARGDPVVTVAVRSDGSVDDIVIHRSSGRPELDEAVRRIVRINARYSAFPPELARRFDVIEIRRVWNFDEGLRIVEELR